MTQNRTGEFMLYSNHLWCHFTPNNPSACLNISNRLLCATTFREETSASLLFLNYDNIMIIIISVASVSKLLRRYHQYYGRKKEYFLNHSSTHFYLSHLMYWAPYNVWFTNGKLIRKKTVQLDYIERWSEFFIYIYVYMTWLFPLNH